MVAGRGEADHSQRHGKRNALPGSLEGDQDRGLGFTRRHPLGVQAEAKQPDHDQEQPHYGEQNVDSALKLQDSCAECLLVLAEELRGDDRSGTTANPARCRGARDAQLGEESGTALLADEVADAVVICSAAGAVRHRAGMDCRGRWRKQGRLGRREQESSTMLRMLHLHRDEC